MNSLSSTRCAHWCLTALAIPLLFFAAPNIGQAETNSINPAAATKLITDLAAAGGGGELLGMVQQLLGMAETLKGLFGAGEGKGADEPCEGVVIYIWDTPNCKRIKSGLGSGGGGGGGTADLQSVLDSFNQVKGLVDQFQQLAGGGGGGTSGSTGTGNRSDGTGAVTPSTYDNRFGTNIDELQTKIKESLSGLSDLTAGRIDSSTVTDSQRKQLESLNSGLQPIVNNLTSSQYQSDGTAALRTGNTSVPSSYSSSLSQKINSLLGRLNPLSNNDPVTAPEQAPNRTEYTIDDIESIKARYVDPDSRMADEEYYIYTVTLNNREVKTVTLPAFAPIENHTKRLADTGYRGSALAFLALADQTDTSFTLDEVASVTVAELDPLADSVADNYKEYTIKLNTGIQFIVHTHADMDSGEIENNFRNTGYTGNIDELISLATATNKLGDVGFFNRVKHLVFNGIKNVLSLFTGKDKDNYTEFPITPTQDPEYFTGTNTFKASPTTGDSPLEVAFTVYHPNTTLLFGDGTMQTVSCPISNPEDVGPYDLDDVDEVVYTEIALSGEDKNWHRVYKIKLKDDSVRTAHHWSAEQLENMWESFKATGYTGDIQDLRDMAKKTQGEDFAYNTNDNNPNGTCSSPTVITHTYEQDLTYTAKLFEGEVSNCEDECQSDIQFPPSSELGRISIVIGDNKPGDKKFSASPAFGEAPLTVTFYTEYGDNSQYRPSMTDAQDTMIDFGDGSDPLWVQCGIATTQYGSDETGMTEAYSGCHFVKDEKGGITNQHTYREDGLYRARIIKSGGMCIGACPVTELASINIVVGDQDTDPNFTANPTTGEAPLTVYFKSSYGSHINSVNYDASRLSLDFGDGSEPFKLQCEAPLPVPSNGGFGSGTACTMDAKVCSDGSSVGRVGPNCEFAACPGEITAIDYPTSVVCTADAKLCSDGSYVGRIGPNCEFAACPGERNQLPEPCTSGGKQYPAGSTVTSIIHEDGTGQNISDGVYVCKGGEWVAQGTYYPPQFRTTVCPLPIETKHTYTEPGSYTALITKSAESCQNNSNTACDSEIVASLPITIGSGSSNETNEISFEVKVMGRGISGEGATAPTAWTSGPITITGGQQLAFRWDASKYESCIPFLGDGGTYALSRQGDTKMLTGNTETEGFNINERTGEYRLECAGQNNGEEGVDIKTIQVTVQGDSGYNVGGSELNGSGTNF